MTPKRFEDCLSDLGLNKTSAARFLGYDVRTVRRWAKGHAAVPKAVAMLLELMNKTRKKPEVVENLHFSVCEPVKKL